LLDIPLGFHNLGKNLNLFPVVVIDDIKISTRNVSGGYEPLLLNLPSVKESLDFGSRKLKISNVSLDVSNVEYNGQRFSDRLPNFINKTCCIWWASQTTDFDDFGNTALKIYEGTIRRFSHDDTKCTIELEDRTQSTLHRDVPVARLGDSDDIMPKYKNKPIPMVYGDVDRSPVVFGSTDHDGSGEDSYREIFYDSRNMKQILYPESGDEETPTIYYLSSEQHPMYITPNGQLNYENPHTISLDISGASDLYAGTMACRTWAYPTSIRIPDGNPNSTGGWTYFVHTTDYFSMDDAFRQHNIIELSQNNSEFNVVGAVGIVASLTGGGYLVQELRVFVDYLSITESKLASDVTLSWRLDLNETINANNDHMSRYIKADGENINSQDLLGETESTGVLSASVGSFPSNMYIRYSADSDAKLAFDSGGTTNGQVTLDQSQDLRLFFEFKVTEPFARDYFANVRGRDIDNYRQPTFQIADIVTNELGFSNDTDPISTDWKTAFTVSKKIDSKKLIEEIASNTPFIPVFKNDGNFGFAEIKDTYSDVDHIIKAEDVIDYSLSRTNIEDVKTRVKILYEKDYATDEFMKNKNWKSVTDLFSGYSMDFYGLQVEEDGSHPESEYEFEAEYIRDEETAGKLQDFLLAWYCNQHNIFGLNLPLNYLDVEIGDIICFDELLGGMKAYGEDYTVGNTRNGQWIYPYFMVIGSTKSIDKVKLKTIQLHELTAGTGEGDEEPEQGILGDINGDEEVNVLDAIKCANFTLDAAVPTEAEFVRADVNEDGQINVLDIIQIVNLILEE